MLAIESVHIDEHFLYPATLFVSDKPARVQTILGSCVAVCLYDEILHYGGINHYMLPWWSGQSMQSVKYGDIAITRLIEKMVEMGCRKENLVAKIFGGADQHSSGPAGYRIGSKNINTAEKLLNEKGIRLIARSTGGTFGRKIIFWTHKNQVLLKFLSGLKSE